MTGIVNKIVKKLGKKRGWRRPKLEEKADFFPTFIDPVIFLGHLWVLNHELLLAHFEKLHGMLVAKPEFMTTIFPVNFLAV